MTILCYHSVEPNWESPLANTPGEFEGHCAWLARRRTLLPLDGAVQRLDRSGRLPRRYAAVTLDDGFEPIHEHAFPVIKRYGVPTTVFVVAQTLTPEGQDVDWVRTPPPWPLRTLSLEQILEMQDAGIDFQSHSWAHRDLPDLDPNACLADLRRSRELLEDLLKRRVPFLAYPRGRHDADVRKAAERAGYTHAFALPEGPEEPGAYAVPRIGVHRGNSVGTVRVKSARAYLPVRTRVRRLKGRARGPAPQGAAR
jgi:peptidoglycan/xylan/chitin deacetylase (PgdA/CDA1 family)